MQKKPLEDGHGGIVGFPADNAKMHIDSLNFSWNGKAADSYLIQISSDNSFFNIIDQATLDSTKYFSPLQYSTPISNVPYSTTTNYVMGAFYYWHVIDKTTNLSSKTQSFYIIDTRDSLVGTWVGTFNASHWQMPNTSGDTVYQGSLSISKNADGSILVSGFNNNLYPNANNDFDFLIGCVTCIGTHQGCDCVYDPNGGTLTYSAGGVGMSFGGTTTFTGTH